MAPEGPVFALRSYASARDSCRKTTSLRSGELRRGRQVVPVADGSASGNDASAMGEEDSVLDHLSDKSNSRSALS
jgi:hypothetical protein